MGLARVLDDLRQSEAENAQLRQAIEDKDALLAVVWEHYGEARTG